MTLAAVVHHPAPNSPSVATSRPNRFRRPPADASTVVVTLRLTLGDAQDPVAALAELVDRIGARDQTNPAPVWLAEVQRAEIHQPNGEQLTAEQPAPDRPDSEPVDPREQTQISVRRRSRAVAVAGQDVELCRREFDLLLYFAEHPGQVFTRGQLLVAVWGDPYTGERTVDVHVTRLRRKLASGRSLITTVRGVGYRLSDDAELSIVDGGTEPAARAA